MSHPSKIKGTRFESEVVAYLNGNGYPLAERRSLKGTLDKGDIVNGPPSFTLELKNEARLNLAGYMAEAEAEAANAGTPYFAAVVKRRGKGAAKAYVVMPLDQFVELTQI